MKNQRQLVTGLTVSLALVVVLLSLRGCRTLDQAHEAAPADPAVLRGSVPTLMAPQRELAVAVLRRDRYVRSLVASTHYTITDSAAWTKSSGEILGAIFTLRLQASRTMSKATWPVIEYDCSEREDPPYLTEHYQATRRDVSQLMVLVDLPRRRVVAVEPGGPAPVVGAVRMGKLRHFRRCQI